MQSNSVNGQPDIANITVVTDERQVIVPQAITSVVEVNNPGPQGPVGPQGVAGPSEPFVNIGNGVYATTSSLQVTGSFLVSGSSTFTNIGPAIFSGSVNATSDVTMSSALVSGNVTVLGTASINVLQINTTINSTGSNQLGDSANDTQTLYGTVVIPTGSLTVSGSVSFGTSSAGFYWNNTNNRLGIGTSSPASPLHVNGDIRVNAGQAVILDASNNIYAVGGGNQFRIYSGGTASLNIATNGNTLIGTTVDAGAKFYISGSTSQALLVASSSNGPALFVSGSGRVGIGTNTPAYALDVNGTARIVSGLTSTGTNYLGRNYLALNATVDSTGDPNIHKFNNDLILNAGASPQNIYMYTSGSTRMFISSSGNVGIGTATPAITAGFTGTHIKSSTNFGSELRLDTTDADRNSSLTFSTANTNKWQVFLDSTDGSLKVRDMVSPVVTPITILDGGNVGIGTIVPSAQLHVSASTSDAAYSFLVQNSSGQTLISSQNDRTVSINNIASAGGDTRIGTQNGSIVFNQGYNNSLGGNALTFYNGGAASTIQGFSNTNPGIAIGYTQTATNPNPGTALAIRGTITTSGSAVLFVTGSSTTRLLTVASEVSSSILVVSGSGFVGVGTNNPVFKLDVSNPTGYSAIGIQTAASTNAELQFKNAGYSLPRWTIRASAAADGVSGNLVFQRFASTFPMTITSGDNVLIGTSTDSARLMVKGSGTTSGTTALRVENANTSASLIVRDDGNVLSGNIIALNGALAISSTGGGVSGNYIILNNGGFNFTNTSSNINHIRFTSTFAPTSGTGTYVQTAIEPTINQTGGANGITRGLYVNPTLTAATDFRAIETTAGNVLFGASGTGFFWDNTNSRLGIGIATPAGKLDLYDSTASSLYIRTGTVGANWVTGTTLSQLGTYTDHPLVFKTNDVARMRIANTTGNVLIGTTTDAGFKLDVNGTTRVTGSLTLTGSLNVTSVYTTISDTVSSFVGGVAYIGSNFANIQGNLGVGSFGNPGVRLAAKGSGATNATTTFLLQNSTPTNLLSVLDNGQVSFTSPTMSLAASQSAFSISPIISASNIVGGQYYGVSITPTFFQTTGSQTETAFRVAATFTSSNATATTGSNIIADFGSTSAGSQLTVTDVTSGSIYMVNDVSGIPIIEATSNWDVNIYDFPNKVFEKTGSQVNIYGTMRVSGSFILPLSQSVAPQTGSAYWSGSLLFIYNGTRYMSASFA